MSSDRPLKAKVVIFQMIVGSGEFKLIVILLQNIYFFFDPGLFISNIFLSDSSTEA